MFGRRSAQQETPTTRGQGRGGGGRGTMGQKNSRQDKEEPEYVPVERPESDMTRKKDQKPVSSRLGAEVQNPVSNRAEPKDKPSSDSNRGSGSRGGRGSRGAVRAQPLEVEFIII